MSVGPTRGPVQRPGDDRDFSEIFQRLDDLERARPTDYRILWGSLADDGSVVEAGSGDWTTPGGSNPYTVEFEDFPDNPIAVATISTLDSSDGSTVEVDTRTVGSITFQTYDDGGSSSSASFDFIIIGRRS